MFYQPDSLYRICTPYPAELKLSWGREIHCNLARWPNSGQNTRTGTGRARASRCRAHAHKGPVTAQHTHSQARVICQNKQADKRANDLLGATHAHTKGTCSSSTRAKAPDVSLSLSLGMTAAPVPWSWTRLVLLGSCLVYRFVRELINVQGAAVASRRAGGVLALWCRTASVTPPSSPNPVSPGPRACLSAHCKLIVNDRKQPSRAHRHEMQDDVRRCHMGCSYGLAHAPGARGSALSRSPLRRKPNCILGIHYTPKCVWQFFLHFFTSGTHTGGVK